MNDTLHKRVEEMFGKWHTPGHDFGHVKRVSFFAKKIAQAENYDADEAQVAGFLHDIGRTVKFTHLEHAKAGVPVAKELLYNYTKFSEEKKIRILYAILHHSDKDTDTKLANIVQDADKLDGMGAIGIFRAAATKHNLPEYDNESLKLSKETASNDPKTLYEQILYTIRWMDMLYTQTAGQIAQRRYDFMLKFLEELKNEIKESE